MFGCAAVETVPDVLASGTVPLTLAPATALAVAANDTSPVTLAPASPDKPEPTPVITPVVVIVFEPNAFNKVTTFESPYEPPPGAAANTPLPYKTLAAAPSMLIVEMLPNVGVPDTFA